ncbi:MAG: urea carboxylase [Opitutaceae bacterium]|jgi:urea carboxylase|nr:urea carboxylase [Opitutaceae bacterium]
MPFQKVLIANRGAIACRVIRTLKKMGIKSVAVYSEADAGSLHVEQADEAVCIGPAPAAQSYLDFEKVLQAAKQTGATAIHPGYGFLSENPEFAEACGEARIIFIGPTAEHMRTFGLKHTARALAEQSQVPLLPGSGLLGSLEEAVTEAARIGYPVMLKSTAGGGGIGMQLIRDATELPDAFLSVARLAENNFKEGGVFLEKFVEHARHIEVQIFGDGLGHVAALGERDCSAQRRNQKVVEETPAPGITTEARQTLLDCAQRLGESAGYQNAGTVEFVYDADSGKFYFLEVNTRLQVEHGVTEEVTGIDLVEWMVKQAAGDLGSLADFVPESRGASIQVRLYSEDPGKGFQPATGILTELNFSTDARIETWVERGIEVSPYYDPMLAKIIVWGADREEALERMSTALAETTVHGLETNLAYLGQVIASAEVQSGRITTRSLQAMEYSVPTIEVMNGGTQTTVQDYPGRTGYWDVGVPPSGPMDSLSFRFVNRLVGNSTDSAGLEITVAGPTLKFNQSAVIALGGAELPVTLDGESVSYWKAVRVVAGQVLRMPAAPMNGAGLRAYLAVSGGIDVPDYLGSKATFTLGQFGGHAGRAIRAGDVLRIGTPPCDASEAALARELIPAITREWDIGVLYGPHGSPDFFQDEDIADLFASTYEVHYNSARTGVRLIGPKPRWARQDGGEAGLHPSNIHDNAYAVGAIDFTGDMPIILGPDGPSLGGFVCPAAIVQSELWKAGQLKPGDKVRFRPMTPEQAEASEVRQDAEIASLEAAPAVVLDPPDLTKISAIIHTTPARDELPAVCYRRAGDRYLLIEYGPMVLDLDLRFRVHALYSEVKALKLEGVLDLTPGIRSLQVHYDQRVLSLEQLMETLLQTEDALPGIEDMEVPTRIVHLPLSWEDESTLLAIQKYMQIVRKDAPWCPSNIEFIRRINGLDSVEDVKRIAFDASYLVLGLGDVYLGAPVATPVDPRHRLVTTKYNPARTWTPENAVGIGGAYMCVYGMEGPGGYQFIGRTIQMWNRWRQTEDFTEEKPWLLRFFDQIRFYEVSAEELTRFREDFPRGRYKLKVEHETLRLKDYHQFLRENQASIETFKSNQQQSFEDERHRWEVSGQLNYSAETGAAFDATSEAKPLDPGHEAIVAQVPGNVWKIPVSVGDVVTPETVLVILESMKMEINVVSQMSGTVTEIRCTESSPIQAGDTLVVIRSDD